MEKLYKAVMKCTVLEFMKIWMLAKDVSHLMGINVGIFTDPDVPLADLIIENDKLEVLINAADGNHKKKVERDLQAIVVHGMLTDNCAYTNKIAAGSLGIINKSGYLSSKLPTPAPIPIQIVIKRTVPGNVSDSVKFFIEPIGQRADYIVQKTLTPEDAKSFVTVLLTSNSKNLVVKELIRKEEGFYRIAAKSTTGQGVWSKTISFISQQ